MCHDIVGISIGIGIMVEKPVSCCQDVFNGLIRGLFLFGGRVAYCSSSLFTSTVVSITPFVYGTINVYLLTYISFCLVFCMKVII